MEIRATELGETRILQKHYRGGTLRLVAEKGEEITIVCRCDRSHWLATVQEGESGAVLTLVCHNCGSRFGLPYVGAIAGRH
ncbi:MAG: hypothetical protein ACE5KQ_02170 [Thermoplasmata archaeon]